MSQVSSPCKRLSEPFQKQYRSTERLQRWSTHRSIFERTNHVKLVEPPSCRSAASTIVFIGRNRKGNWVAREQNGLFGGLFVSRAQAVKYALFENGNHPETIVDLPHEIEVDFTGPLFASRRDAFRQACIVCKTQRDRPRRALTPPRGSQASFPIFQRRSMNLARWIVRRSPGFASDKSKRGYRPSPSARRPAKLLP